MKSLSVSILLLLLSVSTLADPCPEGYTQAPNGGDCFKENELMKNMYCNAPGIPTSQYRKIIGMRCFVGEGCKWDDGTPVDYHNFYSIGRGCFVIGDNTGTWFPSGAECDSQKACWICRVKAKTFDCAEDETAFKGGCVSVHSEPLDQKTADDSCPIGGHLVSIHSEEENTFYKTLASNAGLTMPFYVGGSFFGSKMTWIDQTHKNYQNFARFFPNMLLGDCVQVMMSTEFGSLGQWTNVDCATRLPYLCFRDGRQLLTTTTKQPTTTRQHPLANATCPPLQYFNLNGKVYSPNYPFSIPTEQKCEYVLSTDRDTKANIKFPSYDCPSGSKLTIFDGLDSTEPLLAFTSAAPSPIRVYTATSNVIKIVFEATNATTGTGWEAEFFGLKK